MNPPQGLVPAPSGSSSWLLRAEAPRGYEVSALTQRVVPGAQPRAPSSPWAAASPAA